MPALNFLEYNSCRCYVKPNVCGIRAFFTYEKSTEIQCEIEKTPLKIFEKLNILLKQNLKSK